MGIRPVDTCKHRQRLAQLEGLDHGRQRFQQPGVGRGSLQRKKPQQWPQVAFDLAHDGIDLAPLERALVDGALAGQVQAQLAQPLRRQQGVGLLAHLGKARLPVDTGIHEQRQHLRALFDILAGLELEPVDGLLGGRIDLLDVAPHQGTEGAEQIVVEPLVAVVDEAQQVQMDRLAVHPLELVDGVELDQRGVVAHALGGELDLRDDALGQGEQGSKLLTALDFPQQLLVGEIPRLALDGGDLVQALVVGEQAVDAIWRPRRSSALRAHRPGVCARRPVRRGPDPGG